MSTKPKFASTSCACDDSPVGSGTGSMGPILHELPPDNPMPVKPDLEFFNGVKEWPDGKIGLGGFVTKQTILPIVDGEDQYSFLQFGDDFDAYLWLTKNDLYLQNGSWEDSATKGVGYMDLYNNGYQTSFDVYMEKGNDWKEFYVRPDGIQMWNLPEGGGTHSLGINTNKEVVRMPVVDVAAMTQSILNLVQSQIASRISFHLVDLVMGDGHTSDTSYNRVFLKTNHQIAFNFFFYMDYNAAAINCGMRLVIFHPDSGQVMNLSGYMLNVRVLTTRKVPEQPGEDVNEVRSQLAENVLNQDFYPPFNSTWTPKVIEVKGSLNTASLPHGARLAVRWKASGYYGASNYTVKAGSFVQWDELPNTGSAE